MFLLGLFFVVSCSFVASYPSQGRIVGGGDVDIKDFPYMASMIFDGEHWSGATIVSKDWVLTVASVILGATAPELSFRVGSNDLEGGLIHQADTIVFHPKYNYPDDDYDFVLINVTESFDFSIPNIKPIEFAVGEPEVGSLMTISGWGATEGDQYSSTLRAADVPIFDRKRCDDIISNLHPRFTTEGVVTERMICAGNEEGGNDACSGDIGDPLVDKMSKKMVGMVSFAFSCGYAGPSVYSFVANPEIIKWIKDVTGI